MIFDQSYKKLLNIEIRVKVELGDNHSCSDMIPFRDHLDSILNELLLSHRQTQSLDPGYHALSIDQWNGPVYGRLAIFICDDKVFLSNQFVEMENDHSYKFWLKVALSGGFDKALSEGKDAIAQISVTVKRNRNHYLLCLMF